MIHLLELSPGRAATTDVVYALAAVQARERLDRQAGFRARGPSAPRYNQLKIRQEDPDRCFVPKGTVAALVAAQKAGKTRYIGFTGHKDPIVHLRMLEAAAKHNFRFDAVQMPLNVMDAHFRSFERDVLPILVREQIAVLGMKPLGAGAILRSNMVTAIECLHYALSLPTSVVITGIDSMDRLDQAMEAVKTFKPLTEEQVRGLLAKTAQAAAEGQYEPFKTTQWFDGTARNPQWLG